MSEVITLVSEKLPFQLDSVSWNRKYNLVAVGAYMIDPLNSDKRIGKIFLIKLLYQDRKIISHKVLQEVETSGVLDLRWEPDEEKQLAVATSSSIALFDLTANEDDQYELHKLDVLELTSMGLYAQWMNINSLVCSDSNGAIYVLKTNPLQITASQKVHDNLTWVVQYSKKHDLLFAGSDEGKFTGFLINDLKNDEKHYNKKFEVGVTSIIFFGENILAVGSYDDTLRIFTIDCVDPILLSLKKKIEFGGAPWRTISFPVSVEANIMAARDFYVVAACMRNGIHIIQLNCENWTYKTVCMCLEYEGFLAYGLDANLEVEDLDESRKFTILSCYFDNQQLHFWKTNVPK